MTYTESRSLWNSAAGTIGTTRFRWSGALIAADANAALAKQKNFFEALLTYIPAVINISHPVDMTIHAVNGDLEGTVNASTGQANTVGTGAAQYSALAGAWVTWRAAGFANGRGVTGRTFLVPLAATVAFQTDGTLSASLITALQGAANALILGNPQKVIVIHRGPTPSHPERPVVDGEHLVQTAVVKDKAGVLRSRRDL